MIQLPVQMFPLSGTAAKSGGFVAAVLIGLVFYVAARNVSSKNANQRERYP